MPVVTRWDQHYTYTSILIIGVRKYSFTIQNQLKNILKPCDPRHSASPRNTVHAPREFVRILHKITDFNLLVHHVTHIETKSMTPPPWELHGNSTPKRDKLIYVVDT